VGVYSVSKTRPSRTRCWSSLRSALAACAYLSPIPARTIVAGHGAPCDGALIPTTITYLEFVLTTAEAGRVAGLTPLEVARDLDLDEYAGWLDSERIVGNLHRAYRDLDRSGDEVDLLAALRDMIDYNGGKPSCYA